jgi:hypothetical protein
MLLSADARNTPLGFGAPATWVAFAIMVPFQK